MTVEPVPAPASPPLRPAVRAMLWVGASSVLFTAHNLILKALSTPLDPWSLGFLRYFIGFVIVLPLVLRLGLAGLGSRAPALQALRGVFHAGGLLLWFAALPDVSMAQLTAINFTGPIFVCLGAALVLGERMTAARWAGVLTGFAGVLIVVHPWAGKGFGVLTLGTVLLLCAAPVIASSYLVAKVLTRHDRVDAMLLWQHGTVALFTLPFAIAAWTMPTASQLAWIVLCAGIGVAGHYCLTRAFRTADVSVAQPVRFLELIWASIGGIVVFASWPDLWTIAGGTVIFLGTLWLARSETRH